AGGCGFSRCSKRQRRPGFSRYRNAPVFGHRLSESIYLSKCDIGHGLYGVRPRIASVWGGGLPAEAGGIRAVQCCGKAGARKTAIQNHGTEKRKPIQRCDLCEDRPRSEEHTSELQSRENLVCRLLL